MTYKRRTLNPIIDWTTEEVWEFIHEYNVPYCKLYDEGYKRLGCIGCPMGTVEQRISELKRYPKYKQAYIQAFNRMIAERNRGIETQSKWQTKVPNDIEHQWDYWLFGGGYKQIQANGTEVMKWYMNGEMPKK